MLDAIRKVIESTPLLSPSASRLLQVNSDPECSLEDVIAIVRFDAALTARVLRVVNSAAFGLVHPVESVERAVSYLGGWMVVTIAIGDCADRVFQKPLEGYEGERGSLWRHDLFSAFSAREITRFARLPIPAETAFTAGLLHDIGKAVISDFLKGSSGRVLQDISEKKAADYPAAERQLVGVDHAEVGYELARVWGFSDVLQKSIRYHHRPHEAEEAIRPLVYAVHLGDLVAMMGGYGTGSDSMQHQLMPGYASYFDLSPESLEKILLAAQQAFARAEMTLAATKEA
jgi:putative nucleotidyltransferase with HDIG domain